MGMKRVLASVLAAAMIFGCAVTASAADSPVKPDKTATTYTDKNAKDHNKKVITSTVSKKAVTVVKVTSNKRKGKSATTVVFKVARNKKNKKVAITNLGNKKKGIFDSKKGRRIKKVYIASKKKVTINKNAFKGSKVTNLYVKSKLNVKKNAFKGTKVKNLKIKIYGPKKTAKSYTFAKGAFKGLSSKAKVTVSKKTMTKKQFKKLAKKLRKAGFKGKIVRK